jgi:hypothetical protein
MLNLAYINWKIINLRLSGLVKILFLKNKFLKTVFLTRHLCPQASFASRNLALDWASKYQIYRS